MCKQFFSVRMLEAFLKGDGCDFIGVDYYGRMRVRGFSDVSPVSSTSKEHFAQLNVRCDDMWEPDPEWLVQFLPDLTKRYGLPLYITEFYFVSAMTTVSAVVFLYTPDTTLASVAVVNMDDAGDTAAAAMGMLIILTNIVVKVGFEFTSRWAGKRGQAWRKR